MRASSGAVSSKAPLCTTAAPTPVGGGGGGNGTETPGYEEYAPLQRVIAGTYVGNVGSGRRRQQRQLQTEDDDPRATMCWTMCSDAGFLPPNYFSLEIGGQGACFCSQDGCVACSHVFAMVFRWTMALTFSPT